VLTREEALGLLGLSATATAQDMDRGLADALREARDRAAHARGGPLFRRYQERVEALEQAAVTLGRPIPGSTASAGPVEAGLEELAPPAPLRESAARERPSWLMPLIVGLAVGLGIWFGLGRSSVEIDAATGLAFVTPRGSGIGIGRTEVTQAQFARFVAETRYVTDAEARGSCLVYTTGPAVPAAVTWQTAFGSNPEAPVVCVSWRDAAAYVAWASSKMPGWRVRLPTGAEWTWMASAGRAGQVYGFGDDAARIVRFGNTATGESALPWAARGGSGDGASGLAVVARYRPNGFGLHDVHGNVWEWTDEIFSSPGERVIRGGGWASHPANAAIMVRNALGESASSNDVGFRVVRSRENER
jgi:hypothetical protein